MKQVGIGDWMSGQDAKRPGGDGIEQGIPNLFNPFDRVLWQSAWHISASQTG